MTVSYINLMFTLSQATACFKSPLSSICGMIETQVKISPRHLSPALLGVLLASSSGELLTELRFQQFPPSAQKLVKYSSKSLSTWSWLLVLLTLFCGQCYPCWFVLTVNLTEVRIAMETKLWECQ